MRRLQQPRGTRRRRGKKPQHPPPRGQGVPSVERPRDRRPLPGITQSDGRGVPPQKVPVPLPHGPADGRGQLGEELVVCRGELLEERARDGRGELPEASQGDVPQRREANEREGSREQRQELLVRRFAGCYAGEEAGFRSFEDVAVGLGTGEKGRGKGILKRKSGEERMKEG